MAHSFALHFRSVMVCFLDLVSVLHLQVFDFTCKLNVGVIQWSLSWGDIIGDGFRVPKIICSFTSFDSFDQCVQKGNQSVLVDIRFIFQVFCIFLVCSMVFFQFIYSFIETVQGEIRLLFSEGGSKWSQKNWLAGTTDHILLRKIRSFLEAVLRSWLDPPPPGGWGPDLKKKPG